MERLKLKLDNIANAIREKTGGTELLSLDEMPVEIAAIETGIDTTDATAVAGDILSGKTAYVNDEKLIGTYEGVELDFKVIKYATNEELQNDKPVNNTIGIVTDVDIPNWIFNNNEPVGNIEEGTIWIKTTTSSPYEFNGLKVNGIQIYPSSIKQYVSSAWASKPAFMYQDESWNSFNMIPTFTYTGTYTIVDDDDNEINISVDNWKVRFLTSGVLIFSDLRGAEDGIDVFCVGGGGGTRGKLPGGGSGYTNTLKNVAVTAGTEYTISIGACSGCADGGATIAFGCTANGGKEAGSSDGGAGGSQGGVYNGAGYSDGGGSQGQGTTTREFGNPSTLIRLYAGGGGGLWSHGGAGGGGWGANVVTAEHGRNGETNTGSGGGGGESSQGWSSGGSGIVIIRNKRG